MFNIIRKQKYFLIASATLNLLAIISVFIFHLNLGIDFKGGTLWELKFAQNVENEDLRVFFRERGWGDLAVHNAEEGKILKFRALQEGEHDALLATLQEQFGEIEELSYETIGPTISAEIKKKAILSLVLASLGIILYIAWAFRKVSKPISSWQFGIAAIIALVHDLLVMLLVFVIMGRFWEVEINTFFITAMLTVLGYSVNDTIVVFDRIRERLKNRANEPFPSLVNKSINETILRSLNTGLATILVLIVIFLFGGESTKWFILAMIVGIVTGTYSSIFIASPMIIIWEKLKQRRIAAWLDSQWERKIFCAISLSRGL